MTASLADVVDFLDRYLRIADVPDHQNAVNGLEVENSGTVTNVVAAVDASQRTIDRVADAGTGTLLLVHHGLFWDGNQPVSGRRYRRLRALLASDTAVYGAHIPLDVHPDVGNNAVLARALGIADPVPFDVYRGLPFGAAGTLAMPRELLGERLTQLLGAPARLIAGGPEQTARVGVITGAGGDRIGAAAAAGLDTFITGEGMHHTAFDALESGVNVFYAGHYATETVGVKALAALVSERFALPWAFHDHPTGM